MLFGSPRHTSWSLATKLLVVLLISILFLLHNSVEQSEASHFQYSAMDYITDYDRKITVSFVQAWRWGYWYSSSNPQNDVGKTQSVGYLMFISPSFSQYTVSNPTSALELKLKIKNVYPDPLFSNDNWFFAQSDRTLDAFASSSNPSGLLPTSASPLNIERFIIYFIRCCRIIAMEEQNLDSTGVVSPGVNVAVGPGEGNANTSTVWIDRRRRYSIQSRTFPREYLYSGQSTAGKWSIPSINRDNAVVPKGTFHYASPTGNTWTNGLGASGLNIRYPHDVSGQTSRLQVADDGAINWTPTPRSGRTQTCKNLISNLNGEKYCTYANSYTIEDRAIQTNPDSATNASNRIGTQVDFLFLVIPPCTPSAGVICPPELTGLSVIYLIPTVPQTHRYRVTSNDNSSRIQIQHDPEPLGIQIQLSHNTINKAHADITFDIDIDGPSGGLICLKALAGGRTSVGILCPKFIALSPEYLFLTGTLRTFTAGTNSISGNFANAVYAPTIDNTIRKPTLTTAGTSVSQSAYNNWWSDSAAQSSQLYTIVMTQWYNNATDPYVTPAAPRIYSFIRPFWDPVPTGQYFTYELHTSIDLLTTETLRFGATGGELVVYMNNTFAFAIRDGLNGYTNPYSDEPTPRIEDLMYPQLPNYGYVKNLTASEIRAIVSGGSSQHPVGLKEASNFPIDIFYTHRNLNDRTGFFMEFANSTACSALAVLRAPQYKDILEAAVIFDYSPAVTSEPKSAVWTLTQFTQQATSLVSITANNELLLMPRNQVSTSSAIWTNSKLKVLSGFEAKFTFRADFTSPGFAFVLQNDRPTARGSDGSGLGYSYIKNAIAIEFDAAQDTGLSDPSYHHISVHKPNADGFTTAVEDSTSWPASSKFIGNIPGLPFNWVNNTNTDVTVTLIPTKTNFWLYVYVNANVKPLYTASFTIADMKTWFPDGAYLGFTTSNTPANAGNVYIRSFKATVIPALAQPSGSVTGATTFTAIAGTELRVQIQLKDACGTPLFVPGEASRFFGRFVHQYSSVTTPSTTDNNAPVDVLIPTITDAGDGKYTFSAYPRRSGTYSLFTYYREVNQLPGFGQPIAREAFATPSTAPTYTTEAAYTGIVTPSIPVAATSQYFFGEMTASTTNTNDVELFQNAATIGVSCFPISKDGYHLQTGTGIVRGNSFNTVNAYTSWLNTFLTADIIPGYVLCVNKATVTTAIAGILNNASNSFTGTTSNPFSQSTPNTSAVWVVDISLQNGSETVYEHKVIQFESSQITALNQFWSLTIPNSDLKVIVSLQSAAPRWTSNEVGRGAILVHPPLLTRPSQSNGSFYIYVRDLYGNDATALDQQTTISMTAAPALPSQTIGTSQITPGMSFYPVEFTTNRPGTHLLNLYTANGEQIGTFGTLVVSAGAAHYTTSQQIGITVGGTVDTPMSFRISLYDLQSYRIAEQLNKAEITAIQWVHTETGNIGFAYYQDGLTTGTNSTRRFWTQTSSLPEYLIEYTPDFAGTYYVKVYINSVCDTTWVQSSTKDCRANPAYEMLSSKDKIVAILAGPPAPPSQVIQINPGAADGIALAGPYTSGELYTFRIESKDHYGNSRFTLANPDEFRIQFFTDNTYTTQVNAAQLATIVDIPSFSANNYVAGNNYLLTQHIGNGIYSISIVFTIAGPVHMGVYLQKSTPTTNEPSGIIRTLSNAATPTVPVQALISTTIIPGVLSPKSEFAMFKPTNFASPLIGAPFKTDTSALTLATSFIAQDVTATSSPANVYFMLVPRDRFGNKITYSTFDKSLLTVQYTTNEQFYSFGFDFAVVGLNNDSNVIGSIRVQVAGLYEVDVAIAASNVEVVPYSGYTSNEAFQFNVVATIPHPPTMTYYVQWPLISESQGGDVVFNDIDRFANVRKVPSEEYTYELWTKTKDGACSTLVRDATCVVDGTRPGYKCASAPRSGTNDYYIVPIGLTGCLASIDAYTTAGTCPPAECAVYERIISGDLGTTDAYIARVEYFDIEPTSLDATSVSPLIAPVTTGQTPVRPTNWNINRNADGTSADTWMIIHVVEASASASEPRTLSLEPQSGGNSLFKTIAVTSRLCTLGWCSAAGYDTNHRLYSYKIQYNQVATEANKNWEFVIKYRQISGANSANPYSFTIVPGLLAPATSIYTASNGIVNPTNSYAGEVFKLAFTPFDKSRNAITTQVEWARSSAGFSYQLYHYIGAGTPTTGMANLPCTFTPGTFNVGVSTAVVECTITPVTPHFEVQKVEALYLSAKHSGDNTGFVVNDAIGRTIRPVRIDPTTLSLPHSTISLLSTTPNIFNTINIFAGTEFSIYLDAKDRFGNPTTFIDTPATPLLPTQLITGSSATTNLNIKYIADGTTESATTAAAGWTTTISTPSRIVYERKITIPAVSRVAIPVFAELALTPVSTTSKTLNQVAIRSLLPLKHDDGYDVDASYTDVRPHATFVYSDATLTTKLVKTHFDEFNIDSSLSLWVKIVDINGYPFVQNLASTPQPFPDDTNYVIVELLDAGDRVINVPVEQLRTSGPTSAVRDGVFSFSATSFSTTGTYQLMVYATTITSTSRYLISTYTFNVAAGLPKMDYTSIVSRSPTFVTGATGQISFRLYDRLNNLIEKDLVTRNNVDNNPYYPPVANSVQASLHIGRPECLRDIHDYSQYSLTNLYYKMDYVDTTAENGKYNRFRSSITYDSATSTYTANITPAPTGTYTLNLTYVSPLIGGTGTTVLEQNHVFSCESLIPFTFNVETGAPHSSRSYFTMRALPGSLLPTPTSGYAGHTYEVDLFLLDFDGSAAKSSTDAWLFWTPTADVMDITTDLYHDPTTTFDPVTGLVNDTTKSNLLYLSKDDLTPIYGTGFIRFTFRPRVATPPGGTPFNFRLFMRNPEVEQGGEMVPGPVVEVEGKNPNTDATMITLFTVLHGIPSKVVPSNFPSSIVAGSPFEFNVIAEDAYGNPVTTNTLSSLTVQVTRVGSTMNDPLVVLDGLQWSLQPSQVRTDVNGVSTISFTPSWEGEYTIEVVMTSKDGKTFYASESIPLSTASFPVYHATCAGQFLATNPNGNVLDAALITCASTGECVRDVSACSQPTDRITCPAGQQLTATGTCTPLPTSDWKKCTSDNTYVPIDQDCPVPISCPSGTQPCTSSPSQCRTTSDSPLCPSTPACPLSMMICPNNLSCATSLSECPTIPTDVIASCEATGGTLCSTGSCVNSLSDCPTPKTCGEGLVLCLSDNSCQVSASKCPIIPTDQIVTQSICEAQFPKSTTAVLCPDGRTCASAFANCPSAITCPTGYALCQDNSCQASSCPIIPGSNPSTPEIVPNPSTISCALTEFRCSDGTCVQNLELCPSQPTCPSTEPILCSDRSCKSSLALCSLPKSCSERGLYQCPSDSTCVTDLKYCSPLKTCPTASPVLCSSGACVDKIETCKSTSECPPATPFQCSSGSCRLLLEDCPSLIGCPANRPLRCNDGSCSLSLDLCKSATEIVNPDGSISVDTSLTSCPTGLSQCPTGECSTTLLTCPTHSTCPVGSTKCVDGSCRQSCTITVPNSDPVPIEPPTCATRGLITCPIASSGYSCARTLAECPQGISCPVFSPVKCAYDATCAISVNDCPALPTDPFPSDKVPCADGSWVVGTASDCPTSVSCPPNLPIKCFDQTCSATLSECPQAEPCPESEGIYRCTSGQCVTLPWDCGPVLDGGIVCSGLYPIKCPVYLGTTKCVNDITQCDVYQNVDDNGFPITDPNEPVEPKDPYTSPCAPGYTYCRNGSCQESASFCPAVTCPVAFSFLCQDGSCAQSESKCPNPQTGCPWDAPLRCAGIGNCVAKLSQCPKHNCEAPQQACTDGTCREVCNVAANGCALSEFRCHDGTCVSEAAKCFDQANTGYVNSCPPGAPYRCGNGLCVAKSSQCVTLDPTGVCTQPSKPVLCATGECVLSTQLCPLVKPCQQGYVRCDDGSCKPTADSCPNYSSCPTGQIRCKSADYPSFEILDGLCAFPGECLTTNACPLSGGLPQQRCPTNGRCVTDEALCKVNLPTTNGCPSDKPFKCWNGECVTSNANCVQTNGCPKTEPTRCANGQCIKKTDTCTGPQLESCSKTLCADGSCVDNVLECKTSFGCPVDKPVRCYDGSCRQYPAKFRSPIYGLSNEQVNALTCPPVISCPSTAYTMCADGSCVLSPSLCPSTPYPCTATEYRCLDGTCRPSSALCGFDPITNPDTQDIEWVPSSTKPVQCPASLPTMCSQSGQCTSDITSCNANTDPTSTTITGSPTASQKDATKPFQVLCQDGSYRSSYTECRTIAKQVNEAAKAANPDDPLLTTCIDYCPDGQCLVEGQNPSIVCGIVGPCPAGKYRCFDGSCLDSCDEIQRPNCFEQYQQAGNEDKYDEFAVIPNVDGVCRQRAYSVQHRGCGMEANEHYQCPNRECVANSTMCTVSITDADNTAATLLFDSPFASRVRKEEEAKLAAKKGKSIARESVSFKAVPNSIIAQFSAQQDEETTPTPTPTEPSRSCTSNCVASYNAVTSAILYSPLQSTQTYAIAPLATGATLQFYSGLEVDNTDDTNFYVHQVGENTYYNATNRLTYSRIPEFNNAQALTSAQTVLSPILSCSTGRGLIEPFAVGIQFTSLIDRSMTPQPAPQDVCLARLRRFPEHNYAVWECVFTEEQRTSGDLQYSIRSSPTQPLRKAVSFITQCYDDDLSIISQPTVDDEMNIQQDGTTPTPDVRTPAVYAYIHSPVATSQVYLPPKDTFWRDNIIWLLFVIIGGVLVIFLLAYAILRLSRYNKKSDKVKQEIEDTEKELHEMENFGGDKRRDQEVGYTNNPLAVSLAQEKTIAELGSEEVMAQKQAKLQRQQEEQLERQEIITQLETENEAALAHLQHLQKRSGPNASSPGPKTVSMNSTGSGRDGSGVGRTGSDVGRTGSDVGRSSVPDTTSTPAPIADDE